MYFGTPIMKRVKCINKENEKCLATFKILGLPLHVSIVTLEIKILKQINVEYLKVTLKTQLNC